MAWHALLPLIYTRKLSYRKDDRAMRPIYECPENFRESLTMPTATFPEISPLHEIIAIGVLDRHCEPQSWGLA